MPPLLAVWMRVQRISCRIRFSFIIPDDRQQETRAFGLETVGSATRSLQHPRAKICNHAQPCTRPPPSTRGIDCLVVQVGTIKFPRLDPTLQHVVSRLQVCEGTMINLSSLSCPSVTIHPRDYPRMHTEKPVAHPRCSRSESIPCLVQRSKNRVGYHPLFDRSVI